MPILRTLAERQAANVSAVDAKNAEPIEVAFLSKGRADPSRLPAEIMAVLRTGGGEEGNLAGGTAQDWRTRIAAGQAELHVDRSAYPGLLIRPDDKIRAISRAGQPWFQVSRVDDRGDTRLVLALTEA